LKLVLDICHLYLWILHKESKEGGREDLKGDVLRVEKLIEKIEKIHLHVQKTQHKSQEKYKARLDQHKIED